MDVDVDVDVDVDAADDDDGDGDGDGDAADDDDEDEDDEDDEDEEDEEGENEDEIEDDDPLPAGNLLSGRGAWGGPGGDRGPAGGGSNWKVSRFPIVLLPAYSLLKQEQLQLAQLAFVTEKNSEHTTIKIQPPPPGPFSLKVSFGMK